MRFIYICFSFLIELIFLISNGCNVVGNNSDTSFISKNKSSSDSLSIDTTTIIPAALRSDIYLPTLRGQRVGVIVNQSSLLTDKHLLDFLLENKIDVVRIFTPEHGFRGDADAGENFSNSVDSITGIEIFSLFGKEKKPTPNSLTDVDWLIFDIQDVGVRFYTYISTMHYAMEACAENNIRFMVLDRPNPNGDYVDGTVLKSGFTSFVGMHPIPVVHGLTVGELALMINGEGWLSDGLKCDLQVVVMENYTHKKHYSLPVRPSPNLPNDLSIRLYPSLCFFEATSFSVGRGTSFPFQMIGYPDSAFGNFSFVPKSIDGMAKNPVNKNKECFGVDLRNVDLKHRFTLKYLLDFYSKWNKKEPFFFQKRWMDLLSGTDSLRIQIEQGRTENEIRKSWQPDLTSYKKIRKKYLLYEDFER